MVNLNQLYENQVILLQKMIDHLVVKHSNHTHPPQWVQRRVSRLKKYKEAILAYMAMKATETTHHPHSNHQLAVEGLTV